MRMIFIGHRGAGKSSLLQRLQIYLTSRGIQIPVFDLDREIERQQGKSIQEIFNSEGESSFRDLEWRNFQRLTRNRPLFAMALGAGFPIEKIDGQDLFEIVWVRRQSDHRGRIFNDRPRLNPELDQLEEFQFRFQLRDSKYANHCSWIYDLPEGLTSPNEIERRILFGELQDAGGALTLLPHHFIGGLSISPRVQKFDLDAIEIRDDLLTQTLVDQALIQLRNQRILYSFRQGDRVTAGIEFLKSGISADWALELGQPPVQSFRFLSLHQRDQNESFTECILKLEESSRKNKPSINPHLKLAVPVRNMRELREGFEWQGAAPQMRSFLPQSESGQWTWARLWLKDRQELNFWREGLGTGPDQPTLFEWLSSPSRPRRFGAVLGNPVDHSFSPAEHNSFFRSWAMPYFRIQSDLENFQTDFKLLKEMGLRFASVTSPLKKMALAECQDLSVEASELQAVNSIYVHNSHQTEAIHGHNTDLVGFSSIIDAVSSLGTVFVWGGGGTLEVIRKVLPKALFFSSRTGDQKQDSVGSEASLNSGPDTLIWAAPPDSDPPAQPWHPQTVIDLNYREDSRARLFAEQIQARYISGFPMFKTQAAAQRQYWERFLEQNQDDTVTSFRSQDN